MNERQPPTDLALTAAEARIVSLESELAQLRANAAIALCLWCQARVENTGDAIAAHLEACPDHPMRKLEREVQRLRALLDVDGSKAAE